MDDPFTGIKSQKRMLYCALLVLICGQDMNNRKYSKQIKETSNIFHSIFIHFMTLNRKIDWPWWLSGLSEVKTDA